MVLSASISVKPNDLSTPLLPFFDEHAEPEETKGYSISTTLEEDVVKAEQAHKVLLYVFLLFAHYLSVQ